MHSFYAHVLMFAQGGYECVDKKVAGMCVMIFLNCLFPPLHGHIKTLQSIRYRLEKPAVQFALLWS